MTVLCLFLTCRALRLEGDLSDDFESAPSACLKGRTMEARDLFRNPRFVALWIGIWAGMLLAVENVVTKVNLLMQLG